MLMAGDVSVAAVRGNLVITGDANLGVGADESILIEHDGTNYSVTGLSGTTINGGAGFVPAPIARDIIVDLKTGNDNVEILGASINNRLVVPRNLTIRGGTGVDSITVENVLVQGVLNVDGGAGDNTVKIKGSRVNRDALIKGGLDGDEITVDSSSFGGKLTIDALGGTNEIYVEGVSSVARDALLKGGVGTDTVKIDGGSFGGKLTIDALGGTNEIYVEGVSSVARDALLKGGVGTDTVKIDGGSFGGKLTIDALGGANVIEVKNVSSVARDALIRGGANVDDIAIDGVNFLGKLTVDALGGLNTIAVRGGSSVARDVLLKGGLDSDTITAEASGFKGKLTIDSGAGSDVLTLANSDVTRDVLVRSVSGDNDVSIDELIARAKLTVTTGGGKDLVRILSSTVTGALSVSTGAEADDIGLNSVSVASNITINAGLNPADPEDTLEEDQTADRIGIVGGNATNVTVDAGDSGSKDRNAGVGEVGITNMTIRGNLTIKTGHNADLIGVGNDPDLIEEMAELLGLVDGSEIGPVSVGNIVSIVSGMGRDRIRVDSVTAKVFRLDAGLGPDVVKINNLAVQPNTPKSQLSIKMGNGIDTLTLTNTDVNSFTSKLVDGGSEEDTLLTGDLITEIDKIFRNWELFTEPSED
jgi:hypothetical protein